MTQHPDTVQLTFESPLGAVHLAATPLGLAGAWFAGQRHLPSALTGGTAWPEANNHPVLLQAQAQLSAYLAGKADGFKLPLDLRWGTPFQQAVWRALLDIPRGTVRAYGQIAQALGLQTGARAVGSAVGRNPISVIVPCHRVVGAQGAVTGYAGGLERKWALLKLEGVIAPESQLLGAHQRLPLRASQEDLF
jgi:methylated-DNA-[protein]-cysteine S-methyltransferase